MTQRTVPFEAQEIDNGKGKIASAVFTIASGGGSQTVVVQNNEDTPLALEASSVRTNTEIFLDYYNGATIDTSGTDMNIRNLCVGQDNTTNFVFEYGGSYTLGTQDGATFLPGGSQKNTSGIIGPDERTVIGPGETTAVVIRNESNNEATVSYAVFFLDEQEVFN